MNAVCDKKMLICTIGVPHKSKGASSVVYYHYIDYLRRQGFNILHLVLLQTGFDRKDLEDYTHEMANVDDFEIISFEAKRFYEIKRMPPKINIFALPSGIIDKISDFSANYVLCFDILAAGIVSKIVGIKPNAKKIVWLGDLNFQTYFYHALYDVKENFKNIVKLVPLIVLSKLWKEFYKKLLVGWDTVIVCAKSSEKELKKIGIVASYLPYPWPASCKPGNEHVEKKEIPSFVFFGTLTGLGSRSALHFLISFLYKKLVILFGKGKFQIFICGSRGLPKWVENKIKTMQEIKYLGFVDDLNLLLASCHAVIVPIDVPVGNRTRIVTAMAAGALVIAHKNTALGNPELVSGQTCYLADDEDDFIEFVKLSVEDDEKNKTIVRHAKSIYDRSFKTDVACKMFLEKIIRM